MSLAFVFPGQGSQSIGMLKELAEVYPVVTRTFAEASEILGLDLWKLVQEGPEDELNRTENTQPAMLTAGVAVWRVWQEKSGPAPILMAGHSLGEYSALVCSDALPFPEAAAIVRDRGRFMQQAVPQGEGGMAAIIGMEDVQVEQLCADNANGEVLAAVNFNSPGQVVIAGSAAAVARAVDNAVAAGAKKAIMLPVSVPSHCALMAPAAEKMRERLASAGMQMPSIPVLHNVHAGKESALSGLANALAKQIEAPVKWVDTVNNMAASGVKLCIECGPGRVLTGLSRRITRDLSTIPVYDPASLDKALETVEKES